MTPFEWLTLEEQRRLFDYRRDIRRTAHHYLRFQNGIPMGEPYYLLATAGEEQTGESEVTITIVKMRVTPLACPVLP